jgi:hypothetical protein
MALIKKTTKGLTNLICGNQKKKGGLTNYYSAPLYEWLAFAL